MDFMKFNNYLPSVYNCLALFFRIFFIFLTLTSFSQITLDRYDSIPLFENSILLNNAWSGGINSAMVSEIDLNLDGLKDIFLFEKDGNIVRTFINDGTKYQFDPQYTKAFPKITVFAFLADYNCDGYEDLFKFAPGLGGMAVYKNISAQMGSLQFSLVTPILNADYNPGIYNLFVSATDIPAVSDIDNDGDPDILAWTNNGSTVRYFKNFSMETFGNCDTLMFRSVDDCWGKFLDGLSNTLAFPISCKGLAGNPLEVRNCACPANILAIDMDGDNDKDLLLGRLTFKNLSMLTNGGDINSAAIIAQDTLFPSNNEAVEILFPSGFYFDATNDNVKDLLVSTSSQNGTDNLNSLWLYSNSGTNNSPVFTLEKKNFLQETMVDLGSGSNPAFFDHNADGLMDMVVGNFGYYNSVTGTYNSQLALFENTGTASDPVFTLITRDYAGISSESLIAVYPAFGDIDADGDQDMLIGQYYGSLFLYENIAGPGNTAIFILTAPDFQNIDVGWFAAPQIIDLNRDGLLDLLIGEKDGTLNFFENKGTTSVPDFDSVPTIDTLGGIDVEIPCCSGYSSPFIFESSSGKYSMLVGSQKGIIYFYSNIEDNLNGPYTLADSILSNEFRISISMADINNDQKNEIAIGTFPGGMHILKSNFQVGIASLQRKIDEVQIFPNPANGFFTIKNFSAECREIIIQVRDAPGRKIYSDILSTEKTENARRSIVLNLSDQPTGIYFLEIYAGDKNYLRKVVKF